MISHEGHFGTKVGGGQTYYQAPSSTELAKPECTLLPQWLIPITHKARGHLLNLNYNTTGSHGLHKNPSGLNNWSRTPILDIKVAKLVGHSEIQHIIIYTGCHFF